MHFTLLFILYSFGNDNGYAFIFIGYIKLSPRVYYVIIEVFLDFLIIFNLLKVS